MHLGVHGADFLTVGLLVVIEGLLSADNALVMAIMVMGLPHAAHKKVLSYGLIGAFIFRIVATLLALYLIKLALAKLIGGLYLLYLTYGHFSQAGGAEARRTPPEARPAFGLSAFWATVVRIELVNLAFSIDSILVAVGMSPNTWVVLTGGILGIVAMRVVVGQLLRLIKTYPALVDGAFVIIGWVAIKLIADYARSMGWIRWEIRQPVELGIVVGIFILAYVYARLVGPKATEDS